MASWFIYLVATHKLVHLKSPHCIPLVSRAVPAPLCLFLWLCSVSTHLFSVQVEPRVRWQHSPHGTVVSSPVCCLCTRQVLVSVTDFRLLERKSISRLNLRALQVGRGNHALGQLVLAAVVFPCPELLLIISLGVGWPVQDKWSWIRDLLGPPCNLQAATQPTRVLQAPASSFGSVFHKVNLVQSQPC